VLVAAVTVAGTRRENLILTAVVRAARVPCLPLILAMVAMAVVVIYVGSWSVHTTDLYYATAGSSLGKQPDENGDVPTWSDLENKGTREAMHFTTSVRDICV